MSASSVRAWNCPFVLSPASGRASRRTGRASVRSLSPQSSSTVAATARSNSPPTGCVSAMAQSISASLRDGAWRAKTRLQRVPVEVLTKVAKSLRLPLPAIEATGQVTLTADSRGTQSDLHASTFDVSFVELTLNNEAGSIATDKLSARVQGTVRRSKGDWQFDVDLSSTQGQAYVQPIFVDFGAHALRANAAGKLRGTRELTIERFSLDHAQVARASGRTHVDFANEQPLRSLTLQLAGLEFPGAYVSYLQPMLLDTNFKLMQTAGTLAGDVTIEDGEPRSVDLTLRDLTFDDGTGKLGIEALAGAVHWRADTAATSDDASSAVSWRSGSIFGLSLGAAQLKFASKGRQFRLLQPSRIPLLDGALALESFRVRNAGLPSVAFMVDATLEPIDVKRVCQAFGWPEFGGRVGGTISKFRMREGVITLGTTLRAQVFDGSSRSAICSCSSRSAMAALLLERRVRESRPGAHDQRVLVRAHHRQVVRPRRRIAAV